MHSCWKTKAEDLVIEEIEPTGEPLAEIQVERNDGGRSYDIQYYTAGTQKAYISVNGRISFRCRKSYVDTLIHNMEIFEDSAQPIKTTW